MRIEPSRIVDADRTGVARFLELRGLTVAAGQTSGDVVAHGGEPLAFDGYRADLRLDSLDQDGPITGSLSHATITPQECEFVYDLCVAAGFLIINHAGAPLYLVPHGNHTPEDLPEHDELTDVAWVGSSVELSRALSGNAEDFRARPSDNLSQEPRPEPLL